MAAARVSSARSRLSGRDRGRRDPIDIESTETALDKDQSSLTALNFQGLVDLDSFFVLLMSAAVIAIFIFGLMLQRRREYVTLRAQGLRARELQALVLGEAALVALCGLVAGMLVGAGMALLLMHVLRGLFILEPSVAFPAGDIAALAALVLAATVVSAARRRCDAAPVAAGGGPARAVRARSAR